MSTLAVTIERQTGSGGHEIGRRLGQLLGFRVYDEDLLTMAAEKKGFSPDALRKVEEKATGSLLYMLAVGSAAYRTQPLGAEMPVNDQLFLAQSEIIKSEAEAGNGVFVGRCADYVLRHKKPVIRVFIHAEKEARIRRVSERRNISHAAAADVVAKTDRRRANYYAYYTGHKWGRFQNYDMVLDSSLLGIDGTAALIAEAVRLLLAENDAQNTN